MMLNKIWIGTLVLGSFGLWVPEAAALESECMSKLGSCSLTNVPDDFLSCDCADGSGVGGGGGNEWAGLNQAQLDGVCEETLASFCAPLMPPDGVECDSNLGYCVVDNEPDSVFCECEGGGGGGGGGGNEWDGFDDDALLDVCFEQLDDVCGDPLPPDWLCENEFGGCDITFEDGVGWIACGCQGGGGGGPADPDWADLSEEELIEVCFEQIAGYCGGVDPSDTDSTTTDSTTTDSTTTDSTTDDSTTDATAEGGSVTIDPTEPTGGDESSSGGGTESGTVTDPTVTDPTVPDPTDGDESSSGGDAGASDDGAGCACDASGSPANSAWGLALLGLVGWRFGRRRAHVRS